LAFIVVIPYVVDDPTSLPSQVAIALKKFFMAASMIRHAKGLTQAAGDGNVDSFLCTEFPQLHRVQRMTERAEMVNTFVQSIYRPSDLASPSKPAAFCAVSACFVKTEMLGDPMTVLEPDPTKVIVFMEVLIRTLLQVQGGKGHNLFEDFSVLTPGWFQPLRGLFVAARLSSAASQGLAARAE